MTYRLSMKSLTRLQGVKPELVAVVKRAIELTTQDFSVLEGVRSKAAQALYVQKGASKTMDSYHLTGHAVDLVPLVNGAISWDWKYFYPIAKAMKQAAKELGVKLEWGGAWGLDMQSYDDPEKATAAYVASRKRIGKNAFIDGPHFQIPR